MAKPGTWALDAEEHEVDNWASKFFVPSEGRRHERRGGANTDNWTKRKEEEGRRYSASGAAFDSSRERRGGWGFEPSNGQGLDSDNWGRKTAEGGGRPRLNLQPRTLPVGEGQHDNGNAAKSKGSNPFGDARPREVVLKEKGLDPKEIEEKFESLKIKEPAWRKPDPVETRPLRGSSDKQSRRPREYNREFAPSRANEIDDWGAAKKSTVGNGFERRKRGERRSFFSDSQSRADKVYNWASKKSFVPSEGRRHERRGGFESNGGGVDTDNWTKRKEEEGKRFGALGGAFDSLRERRGGGFEPSNGQGLDSDNWGRKREEGGGRPRLNLQPRTLPVGEGQQDNGNAAKPKGANPFGDARPREDVLKEKGQDPKEIEEKLESLKIKEPAGSDGPVPGKISFGSGSWTVTLKKLRILCVEGVQLAISSALDILSSMLPVLSKLMQEIQVAAAGLLWLLLAIRDALQSFELSNADLGRDDKQNSQFRNFIDSILSEHSLSHEELVNTTLELLSIACQFEGRNVMDAVRQFVIQSKDLIRSKPKVLQLNFLKALLQGALQFTNILQQIKGKMPKKSSGICLAWFLNRLYMTFFV